MTSPAKRPEYLVAILAKLSEDPLRTKGALGGIPPPGFKPPVLLKKLRIGATRMPPSPGGVWAILGVEPAGPGGITIPTNSPAGVLCPEPGPFEKGFPGRVTDPGNGLCPPTWVHSSGRGAPNSLDCCLDGAQAPPKDSPGRKGSGISIPASLVKGPSAAKGIPPSAFPEKGVVLLGYPGKKRPPPFPPWVGKPRGVSARF